MIGRIWDRQIATYASQPDGPLKGAGGYIYMYMCRPPLLEVWVFLLDIFNTCQISIDLYVFWVSGLAFLMSGRVSVMLGLVLRMPSIW